MGLWHRLAARIRPTAYELTIALLAVFTGVSEILDFSGSITVPLPLWLVTMWSAAFLVGGVCTIVGVVANLLRLELAGQIALSYGISFFAVTYIVVVQHDTLGSVYVGLALSAMARAWTLRGALKAENEADRDQRGISEWTD